MRAVHDRCYYVGMLSHGRLFATLWTVARLASLCMGFSRKEYWSRLPFPAVRDFSNPGTEPLFPVSSTLSGAFFTTEPSEKS